MNQTEFRIDKQAAISALCASLDVPAASRKKVEARIAFIGRTGFPVGVNAGRGFRGGYTFEQFWQLLLLFQLQRLGLSLTPAIQLIKAHWSLASSAISSSKLSPKLTFYWVIVPPALEGLKDIDDNPSEGNIVTLALEQGDAIQDEATRLGALHFSAINASAIIEKAYVSLNRDIAANEIMRGFAEWQNPHVDRARQATSRNLPDE